MIGTTPTIAIGWQKYSMPTGCLAANTVYVFGSINNGTNIMPMNNFYVNGDTWAARLGVVVSTNQIEIDIPAGASSAASQSFTVVVVTTA